MIDLNNIFIHGRYICDDVLHIYNTLSGVEFNACACFISIRMKTIPNQESQSWMKVVIDNDYDNAQDIKVSSTLEEFTIYHGPKEAHNYKILKASEAIESYLDIVDITVTGEFLDKPKYDKTFLVYGDSTVSSYGNLGGVNDQKTLFDTDGLKGFVFYLAKAFNATVNSVNGSGWGVCFSPWTTPMRRPLLNLFDKVAPLSEVKFDLSKVKPNLAIISLGTNDSYYIINGENGKTKEELIDEFKLYYHRLLESIKKEFNDIPIIMVYGVMRERHNYQTMHEIYLENKDSFNLYEACFEGDGKGVGMHPSYLGHKDVSDKLIELIKVILSE